MPSPYLKDLEDYEEVELVDTVRLGTWTKGPFDYLMALAVMPHATQEELMEKSGLRYKKKRVGDWRQRPPEFRPLENAIRNSPEAAARFLARYAQPLVVANAIRILEGKGGKGERVTEAAKVLLEMQRLPIKVRRPKGPSILARYLQAPQLGPAAARPVEAEFKVVPLPAKPPAAAP